MGLVVVTSGVRDRSEVVPLRAQMEDMPQPYDGCEFFRRCAYHPAKTPLQRALAEADATGEFLDWRHPLRFFDPRHGRANDGVRPGVGRALNQEILNQLNVA